MDPTEYDKRADKLQADLEERAPLVIWKVLLAGEMVKYPDVEPGWLCIESQFHINGRYRANAYSIHPDFLDIHEDAMDRIVEQTAGVLYRLITKKEGVKWTVPSAVKGSA